ncbi:MAG: short-chain dehydrogenase [Micavibrio sp.]|nr:short-chain dehydrogenase [Micavibrio sp.]
MKNPKSILITGASSGIGEALAHAYAKPEAILYLSGRNEERLNKVADQCCQQGASVNVVILDVTDRKAMKDWILAANTQNSLDLVIANAGISGGTGAMAGEPVSQAREIFDVNMNGVLNTIEPVLSKMVERGKGQIVFISSLAGYRGWPTAPAYSASKGAVRFYGEALRGALKQTGVEVNVVCPGFVTSRITDANEFKMPMKMQADKAANIIKVGLEKNKGRIVFPWPVAFVSWLLSILPDGLAQIILAKFPAKSELH